MRLLAILRDWQGEQLRDDGSRQCSGDMAAAMQAMAAVMRLDPTGVGLVAFNG